MVENTPPGLVLLRQEMARQFSDARETFDAVLPMARPIAARVAATGQLLLLGMGASHWANRMVVASYRRTGIHAFAEVLSEHMRGPLPPGERVALVTSQSGASGEINAYFGRMPNRRDHFGLTLNAKSPLAQLVPVLSGRGGPEKPYAATRSIVISLALHAAILRHLGHDDAAFLDVLDRGDPTGGAIDKAAVAEIAGCHSLFLASRGQLHGALEAAALTFMELARTPASALELGQLLHGPLECLSSGTGLILARPVGEDAGGVSRTAEAAVSYSMRPIIFDMGRQASVPGAIHISLPARDGLAGALLLLPAAQSLVIEAAARRVSDFGSPRRTTKVTDGEAP